MNNPKLNFLLLVLCIAISITSCKDEGDNYEVPTSYNFENVSYTGQTDRLGMLGELKAYISTVTLGETLDAGRLAAMYSNETVIANWTGVYGTKKMRDKTSASQQAVFDALLNAAATDSQLGGTAANGTPGLLSSFDGSKTYFVNANGVEYAQILEKGLMGALIMHQQTGIYLEPGKMDVDNSTVESGEGTEMEHHWDESFGYFGVSTDFPTVTNDVRFWGDYCNDRDELLGTNTTIMNAYLKGRAAIFNNDLDTRDRQIDIIQSTMDEVAASTAIHYLNSGITNFNDPALRAHALSEAVAFYYSCQFNPDSKSTVSDVTTNLALIGGTSNFSTMNLWETELENLETAKDNIATIYGWDAATADQF